MLSSTTVLHIVDSMAIALGQAYQLARARLASVASPVLRMMMDRDHAVTETELLRREVAILREQRENASPHQRPAYSPAQRIAIVRLVRHAMKGAGKPQFLITDHGCQFRRIFHNAIVKKFLAPILTDCYDGKLLAVPRMKRVNNTKHSSAIVRIRCNRCRR
ncbi:MAG: hypothetical protein FWD61_10090 [Phycisphaerales bacterium]|nr:hypothetical protein [Phycisphaerales bacterium]